MKPDLIYLSLGAGVQSTALLVMSALRLKGCPKADVAIFADTQDEEPHTYETVEWCRDFGERHGLPVVVATKGRLRSALLSPADPARYPTPPLYTVNPDGSHGFANRKCTSLYKIEVIEAEVRRRLGVAKGRRVRSSVLGLQGISTDEAHRMKPSGHKWLTIRYPLVEAGMNRDDCTRMMREHGYPIPQRSACVYCPFRSDANWQRMKADRPASFEAACRMDEALRDLSSQGFTGRMFLHASRQPLREVDFVRWREGRGQQHLFDMEGFGNECAGVCGV